MHRLDIINCLIKKYNFKTYLELGINDGLVLNRVNAKIKIGVDPDCKTYIMQKEFPLHYNLESENINWNLYVPCGVEKSSIIIICQDSDLFFENLNIDIKFDIIFVDGLHVAEQVFRDITNSIKHLKENGIIVVHDCNPVFENDASPIHSGNWNGTVYLGYLEAINTYSLKYYTVNSDWGCGILFPRNVDLKLEKKNLDINWQNFDQNRKNLLNLIEVSEFLKLMDE